MSPRPEIEDFKSKLLDKYHAGSGMLDKEAIQQLIDNERLCGLNETLDLLNMKLIEDRNNFYRYDEVLKMLCKIEQMDI